MMKLHTAFVLSPLLAGVSAAAGPHCKQNPCFKGFTDIPGIASLCSNAVRPTTTVGVPTSVVTTVTSTITATYYRATFYETTTNKPTSTSCPTAAAVALAAPLSTAASGSLILSKVAPTPTAKAALAPRAEAAAAGCPKCPPVKEGLSSACSCFFTGGPQQTVTVPVTSVFTYTTTATTTTYNYNFLTKTVAPSCAATAVPIYGNAVYAACGSPGLLEGTYQECSVPNTGTRPFQFDAGDCCSACANTLNCFQAYSDPATNRCVLDIRTVPDSINTNTTADCPLHHTYVLFGGLQGSQNGVTYYSGFINGHCAQGC